MDTHNHSNLPIESWDVNAVALWLTSIGHGQYEKRFRDAEINGEILLCADEDMLREMKIKSVGHRLAICKHLQKLKSMYGLGSTDTGTVLSTDSTSYQPRNTNPNMISVPPTQYYPSSEILRLEDMLRERDLVIDEIFKQLSQLRAEMDQMKQSSPASSSANTNTSRLRSHTLPTKGTPKSGTDEAISDLSTPPSSSSNNLQQLPTIEERRPSKPPLSPAAGINNFQESGAIRVYGHKLLNHDFESYKSILVSITDTCSKVLPLAMKKWKINDDWKKYALFMAFKGQEICLSYDDSPLALLLQYKTSTETPVFILKSLRTTESMYVKNDSRKSNIEQPENQQAPASKNLTSDSSINDQNQNNNPKIINSSSNNSVETSENTAVAIYEYKAEREDELDVNIGDRFIIRDKSAAGWWVVEKDGKAGWVPAGCLLENSDADLKSESGPSQGIVLYDYDAIGVNELSIKKGDLLNVQKKYQHWLLADLRGVQGWVPSCYVSLDESQNSMKKFSSNVEQRIKEESEEDVSEKPLLPRSNTLNFSSFKSAVQSRELLTGSRAELSTSQEPLGSSVAESKFSVFSDSLPKEPDNVLIKKMSIPAAVVEKVSPPPPPAPQQQQQLAKSQNTSPGSPALTKLDSLLDSFNPYLLQPDEKSNKASKLVDLMQELGQNMSEWQDSPSTSVNSSLNALDSTPSKDMIELVQSVSRKQSLKK